MEGFTIKVDNKTNFVKQITDNLRSGTTIELTENITVDEMAYINGVDDITINGNGNTITASDNFAVNPSHGQVNLFKVEGNGTTGKNIVLNDLKLVATDKNRNTLDLYQSDVVLNNVVLDNQNTQSGAPLIVNGANVDVTGSFETITGDNSWYAINVDSKKNQVSASINFDGASNVTFTDKSEAKNKMPIVASLKDGDSVENAVQGADKAGITISSNGTFIPSEIPVSTVDELKAAMLLENANIVLQNDIKLTSNLMVPTAVVAPATPAKNITINGNGHKIYADDTFVQTVQPNQSGDSAANSLVTVTGKDITLKNITLQTGTKNVHALNLYQAENVVLDNVVLDHTNSYKGAPLIVGSSDVTVQNGLKAIAGPNSWYAINLDSKYNNSSINFADKTFTFVNNSGKELPVIGVDSYPDANEFSNTVENPGNAYLMTDANGNFVCDHSKTEVRNNKYPTTEAEGYTGDTYCTICGKLLSKGTAVAKVDEHPEIADAKENGTWGKDEATGAQKPVTSAAGSTVTVGTTTTNTANTTNNSVPQTADEMNLGLLVMLLVVSAAGLAGTALYTRKNKVK